MFLLQAAGTVDIVVIVLATIGGILFPAVVMAIVARIVYYYYDGKNSYEERIDELEREVAALRERVNE